MPALSHPNTEKTERGNVLLTEKDRAVVPNQANRLRKSMGDRIHKIYENRMNPGNRVAQGDEKVTDLMKRLIRSIPDLKRRILFEQQCAIVQSHIQKNELSTIPTELIVLLISSEWKRISHGLFSESLDSLGKLAEEVIFLLENSMRSPREIPVSKKKGLKFKTTPNGLRYVLENTGTKRILKIISTERNKFSQEDIFRLLQSDRGIAEIHIHPNANSNTRRILMDILSENRPLLGILRVIPEWRVGTFVIRGVKSANDVLSQQTTDKILENIKQCLTMEFDRRFGAENTTRITSSHNKITIALPKETAIPFPTQNEIDEIVRTAVLEKHDIIKESANRYHKSHEEVRKTLDGLYVGIGESRVDNSGSDLSRIKAAYDSEIHARGGATGAASIERMQEIQRLETDFIQQFQHVRFDKGLQDYPAVIPDTTGNPCPHPLLLDIIRKPGGIGLIRPEELGKKMGEYVEALNRELDYIAPALDFESAFEEARNIDRQFREGIIPRDALETTYKHSLCKPAFYSAIGGKKWVCVMIDIKGMFTKNHHARSQLSRNIAQSGQNVPLMERLDVLGNITRAFIRGTSKIHAAHDNMVSSHGGDEFRFFLEGATHGDIPKILKECQNALGNEGFDIRSSARETIGSQLTFDLLDGELKIAKLIETIGRSADGTVPSFLRHIEVYAESFSPDLVVSELLRDRESVKSALERIESGEETVSIGGIPWLNVLIDKTWPDSLRIQILSFPIIKP